MSHFSLCPSGDSISSTHWTAWMHLGWLHASDQESQASQKRLRTALYSQSRLTGSGEGMLIMGQAGTGFSGWVCSNISWAFNCAAGFGF